MTPAPLSRDRIRAAYQAGIGTVAYAMDIKLESLSITYHSFRKERAMLPSLDVWCRPYTLDYAPAYKVEDYLRVLLGGNVGQLLCQEDHAKRNSLKYGQLAIEAKRRVLRATSSETDAAYAIAFALLGEVDGGKPETTIGRLWDELYLHLRKPPHYRRYRALAEQLLCKRKMNGDQVCEFLLTVG